MVGEELLGAILARSSEAGRTSRIHGPTHWAGVAAAGLTLLDRSEAAGADPLVVLLFALFHDAMRQNDGHDPEHGERGARLAREMRDELDLDDARLELLEEACTYHDKGETSSDPTIGVCWDADRLNLWRVGRRPDAALLSTPVGRSLTEPDASRSYALYEFQWPALFRCYAPEIAGEGACYLRLGDLPEGPSCTPLIPYPEWGVSAFLAHRTSETGAANSYRIDLRELLMGTESRFIRRLLYEGRPLFEVSGVRVGVGSLGEPLLSDAEIVSEVSSDALEVYPNWPQVEKALRWWRTKREGRDPGPVGPRDVWGLPGDRRLIPAVMADPSGKTFGEMVEEKKRELLARWGLLEDYDRMRARRRPAPPRRTPQDDYWNQAPWEVKPWT